MVSIDPHVIVINNFSTIGETSQQIILESNTFSIIESKPQVISLVFIFTKTSGSIHVSIKIISKEELVEEFRGFVEIIASHSQNSTRGVNNNGKIEKSIFLSRTTRFVTLEDVFNFSLFQYARHLGIDDSMRFRFRFRTENGAYSNFPQSLIDLVHRN